MGWSRREADTAIDEGRITINENPAELGTHIGPGDMVRVDGALVQPSGNCTIVLNKPAGYIVSRKKQGNDPTVYALLPENLHFLKPVGRLDKDSRGLLLLTNDGSLLQELTHPKHQKAKIYEVTLDQPLTLDNKQHIETGINIDNEYTSHFELAEIGNSKSEISNRVWRVVMREGKNRQIRRTFETLGYGVIDLLRLQLGDYVLGDLEEGAYREVRGPD